jgi:hypothetical protein
MMSLRQFQSAINQNRPIEERLQMVLLDNNPAQISEVELTPAERDAITWDSCGVAVLGWGKTAHQKKDRIKYRDSAAHVADKCGIPVTDIPADTRELHFETAPQDWLVKMSERVLHLDRRDLWLGSNDSDYHRPMMVTIRQEATKNVRYRSHSGHKRRDQDWETKKAKWAEKKNQERRGQSQGSGTAWRAASRTAAASSSWQRANGQPTGDEELPHMWRWMDIFMILLLIIGFIHFVIMVYRLVRTVIGTYTTYPHVTCRRIIHVSFNHVLNMLRQILGLPTPPFWQWDRLISDIYWCPPPPMPLRIEQHAEAGIQTDDTYVPMHAGSSTDQTTNVVPSTTPTIFTGPNYVPPPPAAPVGEPRRRRNIRGERRDLWNIPTSSIVHFTGCHHLRNQKEGGKGTNKNAKVIGVLCFDCDR